MMEPSSNESVMVDVTTLSDIVAAYDEECVDLLKIDVEGSERAILFPNGDLLKRKVRIIIGEAGNSPYGNGIDFVNFLRNQGFNVEYEGNESQLIFIAKNQNLNIA